MNDINILLLLPIAVLALITVFLLIKHIRDMRISRSEEEFFEKMTAQYSENGVDTDLADKLYEHLAGFRVTKQTKIMYNFYLRWLAIYHIMICEYDKAMELLDTELPRTTEKIIDETGSSWFLCEHYVYRIITAARMGDLDALEKYYSEAVDIFEEYLISENNKSYLINEAMITREIAHGRYDEAETMIRPMFSVENAVINAAANTLMGRCAFGRGDTAGGNRYFDKAKAVTADPFRLECLEIKRSELIKKAKKR